jgi:hypothetical protein
MITTAAMIRTRISFSLLLPHLLSPVIPPLGLTTTSLCPLSLSLFLDAVTSLVPILSLRPLRLSAVLYMTHS